MNYEQWTTNHPSVGLVLYNGACYLSSETSYLPAHQRLSAQKSRISPFFSKDKEFWEIFQGKLLGSAADAPSNGVAGATIAGNHRRKRPQSLPSEDF